MPEIRFDGFAGAWEEKRFDSIAERITSVSNSATLPNVEFEDIISGSGTLNKNVYDKPKTKIGIEFSKGDILFGKLRPYLKNWLLADFAGIAVGDFWVLRPIESDSGFLYVLIQSRGYQYVANLSTGTKMPRSEWSLVSETVFKVPMIAEQAALGIFFRTLDATIALKKQQYEQTVNIKKAMLEKMFPKKGADVPEVRFEGFTGAWTDRKLGSMGVPYTGLSGKAKNDFGHGDAKFVTYINIFTNSITDPNGVGCVEIDNRQNNVRYGDVFFTTSSETPEEVGMSSIWLENITNVYLNSFCFGYRP
ncbi:MAG: restriction endonuclease subunit S, partial [Holophagales bacterium]|nr:restriction endonuclease subunit S [Holophagales bacterium]